jgi:cell division septation protein DedD
MSDQGFREIQLGGKQLVFLFMASVVIAVAVFLLGVSVGRGVRQNAGAPALAADAEPLAEPLIEEPAPAVMPPPTSLSPADKEYSDLDGASSGDGASRGGSRPVADAPAVSEPIPPDGAKPDGTPAASAAVTSPAAARPEPAVPPAPVARDTRRDPPATAPSGRETTAVSRAATGRFAVQVNAFGTRAAADREVASLKNKGHAAFVVASDGLFRVRVGPFRDEAEAKRMATRLGREGFKPLIIR